MKSLPDATVKLARRRHGVLLGEDLATAGMSNTERHRAVTQGLLRRISYRAYAVPALCDPFTSVAAVQLRYPDVVAERRTAAAIWAFDGHRPEYQPAATPLELVSALDHRIRLTGIPIRRAKLPDGVACVHAGLTVTSAIWTLTELAAPSRLGLDELELAVESALRLRLVTEDALQRAVIIEPRLREVLRRRAPGTPPTESYAETRFLQQVVRPLGLEDPRRQVEIHVPGRPAPYRADFLFRGVLDVEIDGEEWHPPGGDAHRDHRLRLLGVVTLHLRAGDVETRPKGCRTALNRELAALEHQAR